MKSNSLHHGNSQSSAYNGNGLVSAASRIITGERLGCEHWWYLI